MKKTITICDKCQKQIPEGQAVELAGMMDICPKCWPKAKELLLGWIAGQNEKAADQEAGQDKQEAVRKPRSKEMKPRKNGKEANEPDFGKMQAIRDSGWTLEKIADEMGCEKSFMKEHTHAPEKKKSYPLEFTPSEPDFDPVYKSVQETKPFKEVEE